MSEWCAGPSWEEMSRTEWHQIACEALDPTPAEILEACGPEYLMYLNQKEYFGR